MKEKLKQGLNEFGVDYNDFLAENTEWFMLEDKQLSPGIYRVRNDKVLNTTYEDLVYKNDKVRISEESYPIGLQYLGLTYISCETHSYK